MKGKTGVVTGVRVSREHASVDDIEAVRRDREETLDQLLRQPSVSEAYVLQTCHRVEAYVVTTSRSEGEHALDAVGFDVDRVLVTDHETSLRHLMRVAAGLESLVLGEDQVLGQVRDAYEAARQADGIGPVLREGVTKAIHVGERARTETAINEGVVSLGSAAVELADRELDDLTTRTALVVGAGEMGVLAAKAFAAAGVDEIVVANRTRARAEWLCEVLPVHAAAVGLTDLDEELAAADVAVTATGSDEPIVDASLLSDAGEVLCIDLGQPRDVDPDASAGVPAQVRDLDDLEAVTDATRERRREAAVAVEAMIDEEFDNLLAQYKRKRADEVIASMYESADRVKQRELSTAMSKLEARGDLTEEQREAVESLADALVSQLLAAPTRSLRDAAQNDDWTTIATALDLFDPDFDGEMPFGGAETGSPATAEGETESDDD
ncbi:glutamyl-tRNA reductase [Halospeciosus flavus]|uniref:Glutamyl-tRNA reductase n=1 Tax=Halospeciosus flavus TaxID=3032283 RepID=A0ABD5Z8K9_9EURY|nr:glutamyl-tRNA reductase [Halospeciosus flavus]